MQDSSDNPPANPPKAALSAQSREARLKAALKANMGRRKAQARARGVAGAAADTEDRPGDGADTKDNDNHTDE